MTVRNAVNRVRRLLFLVLAGSLINPACGPTDTTIRASDFDQACVVDSDCVGVDDGNVCDVCGPSHPAAVARSASSAFFERANSLQSACSRGGCQTDYCSFFNADTPFCGHGTCASCPAEMDCSPDASVIELRDGGIADTSVFIDAADASVTDADVDAQDASSE